MVQNPLPRRPCAHRRCGAVAEFRHRPPQQRAAHRTGRCAVGAAGHAAWGCADPHRL